MNQALCHQSWWFFHLKYLNSRSFLFENILQYLYVTNPFSIILGLYDHQELLLEERRDGTTGIIPRVTVSGSSYFNRQEAYTWLVFGMTSTVLRFSSAVVFLRTLFVVVQWLDPPRLPMCTWLIWNKPFIYICYYSALTFVTSYVTVYSSEEFKTVILITYDPVLLYCIHIVLITSSLETSRVLIVHIPGFLHRLPIAFIVFIVIIVCYLSKRILLHPSSP